MIRKWQGLNTVESLSVCEPKSQSHLGIIGIRETFEISYKIMNSLAKSDWSAWYSYASTASKVLK